MATTTQITTETTTLSNRNTPIPPDNSPAYHVRRPDGTWQSRSLRGNSSSPNFNRSISDNNGNNLQREIHSPAQTIGRTPGNRGVGAPNTGRTPVNSPVIPASSPNNDSVPHSVPHNQPRWNTQPMHNIQLISPTPHIRQPYSDSGLLSEQIRQEERVTPQMDQVNPSHWTDSIRRDAQSNTVIHSSPEREGYNDSMIQRQMALVVDSQGWYDQITTATNQESSNEQNLPGNRYTALQSTPTVGN